MSAIAVPVATYRLQFNASFTFDAAAHIVDYLDALGISHCYASSYFTAVPGSEHGYDVADPTTFNPEIGDDQSYRRWVSLLRAHGMGHIVDLVPNHMGIARSANPWWQDVLENGASSRFASVFDIDWHPLKPELENKVLLPFLGKPYGTALEAQEIRLQYRDGTFSAQYFETTLPIAPGTYDRILRHDADALLGDIGRESDDGLEFLSILTAIQHLPSRNERDPERIAERDREKEVIKRRLAALTRRAPRVLEHVESAIVYFNGTAGDPSSFDALDQLLSDQAYRLAYWRVAAEEINYRRFFDINNLAAIRMEDPAVFALSHGFAFDLLRQGCVDGFRIDHVDGLYDPGDYLARMQTQAREVAPERFSEQPMFLVVEKILGVEETMPEWPVHGTTGYEFLGRVNGLFVDRRQQRAMDEAYDRFTRVRVPFRELAYRGKGLILRMSMASELNVLAAQLNRFSERNRHYRDFTLNILTLAIREIIASFPVYRTYVNERDEVSPRDRGHIDEAVNAAKRRNPRRPSVVFDFVRDLLLKQADYIPASEHDAHMRFVGKFQQATSPVAAKGIEDTALYIYNRLVSLNEVGSEPDRFGEDADGLHRWMEHRRERWPQGLSATATHDTKRGEDVRARINVLSEMPTVWRQATTRWARMNRRGRTMIEGASYPSRNEEYLLYQTLIGTWPAEPMTPEIEGDYRQRIVTYMLKAMREAKVYTSWLNPSEAHEAAMVRFVETVLSLGHTAFRADFAPLARRVARCGVYNSLAQLTLKITAPGIPDFYQGTELWDFTLVDPDNRRPVDYGRRMTLLQELTARRQNGDLVALASDLLDQQGDALKLFVTTTLLHMRREQRDLFESGAYEGLAIGGARSAHVFAFRRVTGERMAIVAVPRLVASLIHDNDTVPTGERTWGDTEVRLPAPAPAHLIHRLTGRCVHVQSDAHGAYLRAADIFEHFPIACLEAR
jgi:(1->4)-alpha-D-glucan 1-alpha-D-glucosylmutase